MYEVVRIKLEKTNAGVYARKSLFEQRSFRNRLAATKKVYPLPRKSLTLNEDVNCTIVIQINHAIFKVYCIFRMKNRLYEFYTEEFRSLAFYLLCPRVYLIPTWR